MTPLEFDHIGFGDGVQAGVDLYRLDAWIGVGLWMRAGLRVVAGLYLALAAGAGRWYGPRGPR
jgi:hypothetical protein